MHPPRAVTLSPFLPVSRLVFPDTGQIFVGPSQFQVWKEPVPLVGDGKGSPEGRHQETDGHGFGHGGPDLRWDGRMIGLGDPRGVQPSGFQVLFRDRLDLKGP